MRDIDDRGLKAERAALSLDRRLELR